MSESETDFVEVKQKPLSPLQLFSAKVAIVAVAILAILYGASQIIAFQIEGRLAALKGGPVFWEKVEAKLYKLVDERDLAPEKKQKIINALRKLSVKYKPYLEAISGESAPGEPNK